MAALTAAAALGVADFIGGLAGRRISVPTVVVSLQLSGFIMLPLAVLLLPIGWEASAALLAFAGGALGGIGIIAFYRAMSVNLIGVVAPITGVVGAGLPTIIGLIGGDRLSVWQLGGVSMGLVAIVLIGGFGREFGPRPLAGMTLAVFAGFAFGGFFVLFHAASSAGVTAFVSGRVAASVVGLVAALMSGVRPIPDRSAWRLIGFGGVLDGGGAVMYLYASRGGLLSITALLVSFYPAFTVFCARMFTGERLNAVQAVGAMMAILAIIMITV
jgi:drug/metabolite transporter (DMT)-like permease